MKNPKIQGIPGLERKIPKFKEFQVFQVAYEPCNPLSLLIRHHIVSQLTESKKTKPLISVIIVDNAKESGCFETADSATLFTQGR